METTEKIVEAYVRYVKRWLTIPNVKCEGQLEIDLLAVDVSNPGEIRRYHIESGVSISGGFSRLTNKPFSPGDLKVRVKQANQRRTLGYFTDRKFSGIVVLRGSTRRGSAWIAQPVRIATARTERPRRCRVLRQAHFVR